MQAHLWNSNESSVVLKTAFLFSTGVVGTSTFLGKLEVGRRSCSILKENLQPASSENYARPPFGLSRASLRVQWPRGFPRPFVIVARAPETQEGKVQDDGKSFKSAVNRVLACRTIALSFIVSSSILYVIALCFVARTICEAAIQPHQRILLLGLGLLLPDFRHVLKSYSDAVHHLQRYRPAFQGFRFVAKPEREANPTKEETDGERETSDSQSPPWLSHPHYVRLSNAIRQVQDKFDESVERFDEFVSNFSRDVTRPIVETRTQIQQLTTGTDLTLQKNVLVAAASVSLSLAGYLASMVEPSIGGVAIMLASLLPNAILSSKKHEMLALIQDGRVAVSLIGTLSCALSVFFPMGAAYCFLLCCLALVVSRFPMDWGFT